jgi:ATP-binding cassette, subfamily C (CFTR/MRP), member 1
VREVRDQEARIMRTIAVYQAFFGLTLFIGPVLVAISSFAAFAGGGGTLTPAKAYTSLALFTLLRFPLAFLPSVIFNIINARIALMRIGKFLSNSEVEEQSPRYITEGVPKGYVEIADGDFVWEVQASAGGDASASGRAEKRGRSRGRAKKDANNAQQPPAAAAPYAPAAEVERKPALTGVNLRCEPGTLTMIVGAVGSGKSSLLSALFQQITCTNGQVKVRPAPPCAPAFLCCCSADCAGDASRAAAPSRSSGHREQLPSALQVGGSISYVPQTAWIMNETVRENVLLGAPLDEARCAAPVATMQRVCCGIWNLQGLWRPAAASQGASWATSRRSQATCEVVLAADTRPPCAVRSWRRIWSSCTMAT